MNTSTHTNGPRRESYSLGDRVQQISREAQALSTALRGASTAVRGAVLDIDHLLTEQVHESPARTLAVAAGLGYILGGGLRSPLTSLFFGIGSRIAIAIAARELAARLGISSDAQQSRRATTPVWSESRH